MRFLFPIYKSGITTTASCLVPCYQHHRHLGHQISCCLFFRRVAFQKRRFNSVMAPQPYSIEGVRPASHADTWYESDPKKLQSQLDGWLGGVNLSEELPVKGARIIIAPHAGYSYSGPCAAWAYRALDVSRRTKRIFVLGPSHTYYLAGMALTTFQSYATPLGDFVTDVETLEKLYSTGKFSLIPRKSDIEEHSLEMHLPYLYTMISRACPSSSAAPPSFTKSRSLASNMPPIVPVLIGNLNEEQERETGRSFLAPYLADEENCFIISSDFCHWGRRFSYTAYVPGPETPLPKPRSLRENPQSGEQDIHESIKVLDTSSMNAIESGKHSEFWKNIQLTKNTICGRHPIGVAMAAMGVLEENAKGATKKFKFVRYERSSLVYDVDDSSVSYGSAYAVL